MSENQVVSKAPKDSTSPFEALNREIVRLQRVNKGLAGQNKRLQNELDGKQVESSAEKPETSQTEPPQVAKQHVAYSFMRDCPECGGRNEGYKAPNVFCTGPECKGVIPLGTIDPTKDIVKVDGGEDIPSIRECWNCGKSGSDLHVQVREPKK